MAALWTWRGEHEEAKMAKRTACWTLLLAAAWWLATAGAWTDDEEGLQAMRVYVGTYTGGKSEGIYMCRLDLSSGALQLVSKTTGVDNPSFLALDPERRYLYAVNEVGGFAGLIKNAPEQHFKLTMLARPSVIAFWLTAAALNSFMALNNMS